MNPAISIISYIFTKKEFIDVDYEYFPQENTQAIYKAL